MPRGTQRKRSDHVKDAFIGEVARGRHPGPIRKTDRRRPTRRNIQVRWGLVEDELRISELLDLNGVPHRAAVEEQFVVAEEGGEILAAVGYRTAPKRLLLGPVIADPWAGERDLAVALYAGVRDLAYEMGAREIHVLSDRRETYPREAGYRRKAGGWSLPHIHTKG